MYPFQNILFTTDFSPNSKSGLKYAAAFARKNNANLYIHNAQEGSLPPQALKLSDRSLAENGYDWVMAIKKEMEEIANSEILAGLKVHMILSEGSPYKEIPRVIKDYNIDLATMSTTSKNRLGGGLGSTTLSIIGNAGCPLLITRQGMHDFVYYKGADTNIALNRILFACDFKECDHSAKRLAIELARSHNAELYIVHSVATFLNYLQSVSLGSTVDVATRVKQDAQERLNQIASEATDIKVTTMLSEGRLYDETLRISKEKDLDLIIIGTGSSVDSSAGQLGRHAERIVRGATCPVLAVQSGTF